MPPDEAAGDVQGGVGEAAEAALQHRAEQPQGVHVEEQVEDPAVEEHGGEEPPPLPLLDQRRVLGEAGDDVAGRGSSSWRPKTTTLMAMSAQVTGVTRRSGVGDAAGRDHPGAVLRGGALRALLADDGVAGALHADGPAALAAGEPGGAVGVAVAGRRRRPKVAGIHGRSPYRPAGGSQDGPRAPASGADPVPVAVGLRKPRRAYRARAGALASMTCR